VTASGTPAKARQELWWAAVIGLALVQTVLYALGIRTILTGEFITKYDPRALTEIPRYGARPIGMSLVAMGLMVSAWTAGAALHRVRGRAPWRAILLTSLALQGAAAALWFPPWKVLGRGPEALFYGSLLLHAALAWTGYRAWRSGFYRKSQRRLAVATLVAFGVAQGITWFWADPARRFGLLAAPFAAAAGGAQLALAWPGALEAFAARLRGLSRPEWSLDSRTKKKWSAHESPAVVLRYRLQDRVLFDRLELRRIECHGPWVEGKLYEAGSFAVESFRPQAVPGADGEAAVEFRADPSWETLLGQGTSDGRLHQVAMAFRCTWSDGSVTTARVELEFA
jgi:hypothetical protein